MMLQLHLLDLAGMPILTQLRLEEALLRTDTRNWCLINKGATPAIVMGVSGKYHEHINPSKMQQHPVPVLRRFSGGGTVIIDEQTCFFTLLGNHDILDVPCYPDALLKWTERLYAPAFKGLDFALRDQDYVIGQRKFGGNAQYITKGRWLHHSSLLWNFRPEMMDYLLMPPRMPTYRQGRSHGEFLCSLHSYFQSFPQFKLAILTALQSQFQLVETNLSGVEEVLEREHRRTTSILHDAADAMARL